MRIFIKIGLGFARIIDQKRNNEEMVTKLMKYFMVLKNEPLTAPA